jgi:hypothetical protein
MTVQEQLESSETEQKPEGMRRRPSSILRIVLVAVGLVLWFWTQSLIAGRGFPDRGIGDAVHQWTAPVHSYFLNNPKSADALLISSSLLINFLAAFILASAVFGPSIRPFLGLLILFALRQVCQSLCALPPPEGMIWRYPGFPGWLVTYGTSNDLFFSGHTAIAVYGTLCLGRLGRSFKILGVLIAVFEIATVLVLRAHYTMDVFTGAVTAFVAYAAAEKLSAGIDRRLSYKGWA